MDALGPYDMTPEERAAGMYLPRFKVTRYLPGGKRMVWSFQLWEAASTCFHDERALLGDRGTYRIGNGGVHQRVFDTLTNEKLLSVKSVKYSEQQPVPL